MKYGKELNRYVAMLLTFVMVFNLFCPYVVSASEFEYETGGIEMFTEGVGEGTGGDSSAFEYETEEVSTNVTPDVSVSESVPELTDDGIVIEDDTSDTDVVENAAPDIVIDNSDDIVITDVVPMEQETENTLIANILTYTNEQQDAVVKGTDEKIDLELTSERDFPDGVTAWIEILKDETLSDLVTNLKDFLENCDVKSVMPLAISVLDADGHEVENLGKMSVKISMDDVTKLKDLVLYHQKDDKTWEELSYEIFDATEDASSYVLFQTDSFSPFLFVKVMPISSEKETEVVTETETEFITESELETDVSMESEMETEVITESDTEAETAIEFETESLVETEFETETDGATVFETESESEIESEMESESETEGIVSYENLSLDFSDYTVYLDKENGALSQSDIDITIVAKMTGTKQADVITSMGSVTLPDGVIMPENLTVTENQILAGDSVLFEIMDVISESTELTESIESEIDDEILDESAETIVSDFVRFTDASVDGTVISFVMESSNLNDVMISFKASALKLAEADEADMVYYIPDGLLDDVNSDDVPAPENGMYFTSAEYEEAAKYMKLKEINNPYVVRGMDDVISVAISSEFSGMDEILSTSETLDVIDMSLYEESNIELLDTDPATLPGDMVGIQKVSRTSGFPAEYAYGVVSLSTDNRVLGYGSKVTKSGDKYQTNVTSRDSDVYVDINNGALMFKSDGTIIKKYDVRIYFWIVENTMDATYLQISGEANAYGAYSVGFRGDGGKFTYTGMKDSDKHYGVFGLQYRFYDNGHVGESSHEVSFKGVAQVSDLDGAYASPHSREANQKYLEAVSFRSGVADTASVYCVNNPEVKRVVDSSASWASGHTWFYGTKGNNGAPDDHKNSVWTLVDSSPTNRFSYRVRTVYTFGSTLKAYYGLFNYKIVNLDDMVTQGVITDAQKTEINNYLNGNSGYSASYAYWQPGLTPEMVSTKLASYGLKFNGWYSDAACTTSVPAEGLLLPANAKQALPTDYDGLIAISTVAYGSVSSGYDVTVNKHVTDPSGFGHTSPAGWQFTISGVESKSTGSDGSVTFTDVSNGSYTLSETVNTDVWDSTPAQTITVDGPKTYDWYNTYKTGNVKIVKTVSDVSGNVASPAGFVFTLTGTSTGGDAVSLTGTTDANGVINFTNIPVGTYTVTEVGTPDSPNAIPLWWDCPNTPQTVTVQYGQTTQITANNVYKTGHAKLVKTMRDLSGNITSPAGFVFRLHGVSDSGMVYDVTGTTNAAGEILFQNIPVGTYTMTEIGTPDSPNAIPSWWDCQNTPQTVTIQYGQTTQVNANNVYKTGDAKIVKNVDDPSGLASSRAGFVFNLKGTSDSGIVYDLTGTTNAGGELVFPNLPIGTYTVTEIGTPDSPNAIPSWWDCRNTTQTIVVKYNEITTVTVMNIYKTGNLQIQKTIEEANVYRYNVEEELKYHYNNKKSGFAFKVTGTSDSGKKIEWYTVTDAQGVAHMTGIPIGTTDNYTVIEVTKDDVLAAANAGNASARAVKDKVTQTLRQYVTPTSQTVSITYDNAMHTPNTTYIRDYHNTLMKWRITVTKQDMYLLKEDKAQQHASLAGAVYGLYDGTRLIDTYVTDGNGSFTTDYYVLGDLWYFKELKGSEGYLADDRMYPIRASIEDVTSGVEFNDVFLDESMEVGDDQNVLYEPVQRGFYKYYKVGGDTFETDKAWLRGAGFSIYSLADLEVKYGLDAGYLDDADDAFIVQWLMDHVRDETTQDYSRLVGTDTALVYCDTSDADVESGKLVKSYTYANGSTITAPNETYAYRVGEIVSDANGVVQTPRLPYGRYVMVETTVPVGNVAAAPRVLKVDHDDKDAVVVGDGGGVAYEDAVVWDADVNAYISIVKTDAKTGQMVHKDGAKYVIHDIDGAYFDWYMRDRTTDERRLYKEQFGDLVVDYSDGYRGSYAAPYITSKKVDEFGYRDSWLVRTVQPLPEGRYLLEEVGAPVGYVKQGHEGQYRVKDGKRFYEIESDTDNKWLSYHMAVTSDMVGKADLNEEVASPANRIQVTVSRHNVYYSPELRGFVVNATQSNEPTVGKLSIYTEGQYLAGTYEVGDEIGFEYTYAPVENAVYGIFAKENIYMADGTNTLLFANGDLVTTLETDADGKAWTEEIMTNSGVEYYGLPIGSYEVKELRAGDGFVVSDENRAGYSFAIRYAGEEVPLVFKDQVFDAARQGIRIEIPKYDRNTKQQVAGATFGLFAAEDIKNAEGRVVLAKDTLITEATTGLNGDDVTRAVFDVKYRVGTSEFDEDGLPSGKYYVQETKAPEGYLINSKKVAIDASYDASRKKEISFIGRFYDSEYAVADEKIKVAVNLLDYTTEQELDDALVEITASDGSLVASFTTKHGENPVITGLKTSETYIITVVKPKVQYSNVVYVKADYESVYEQRGYKYEDEYVDATDVAVMRTSDNTAVFQVGAVEGVQVVSVFAKPVLSTIEVTKDGEVAETVISGDDVRSVFYTVKGLPNAEYDVIAAADIAHPDGYSATAVTAGTVVAQIVTDVNGYAAVKDLYLGSYEVKETKAPRGYFRDADACSQNVNTEDKYMTDCYKMGLYGDVDVRVLAEFVNPRQIVDVGGNTGGTGAAVYKYGVDGETKIPVAGAEFTLYAKENIVSVFGDILIPAGTRIETAVSDAEGKVIFNHDLPVGLYVIRETKHPAGYYQSMKEIILDAEITANDDSIKSVMLDGEVSDPITRTKIFLRDDITKNELEDATLQILDGQGNVVTTFVTTDTNGDGYLVKGLNPGDTYHIREVSPRDGYTTNVIIPENMTDVLHRDSKNQVSFTVPEAQVDENLINMPDDIVISLENAFVTGSFALEKTGEGLSSVKQTVEERTYLKRLIHWVKTQFRYRDMNLSGAEFTVYAAEDIYHPDGKTGLLYHKGDVVLQHVRDTGIFARGLTDETGYLLFSGLYLGSYELKETNIPAGYIRNDTVTPVVLAQTDTTTQDVRVVSNLAFYNVRQKVNVRLTKVDSEDTTKSIAGAVFGLYTKDDIYTKSGTLALSADTLVETSLTNDDGIAVFDSDLPLSHYYVKELVAPAGYTSSNEVKEIDATHDVDGKEFLEFDVMFANEQTKLVFNIMDYNTEVELDDVHLIVLDSEGNVVTEITTVHDGNVIIRGLELDKSYTLVETDPKIGYTNTLYEKPDYVSDYVTNGYESDGVTYDVTELPVQPLSPDSVKFTLEDKGGVQIINLFNKPVEADINIRKEGKVPETLLHDGVLEGLSFTVKGLPNAEYDVIAEEDIASPDGYSENILNKGDLVGHYVTDATGEVLVSGLSLGVYRVTETKAPAGYSRNEADASVLVDLMSYYEEQFYQTKQYQTASYEVEQKFYNEVQKVDVGSDIPTDGDNELDPKDPHRNLYLKTGIVKYWTEKDVEYPVADAEFTLYAKEDVTDVFGSVIIPAGTCVGVAVTDENGRAAFTNTLPIGMYYAKETKAPDGYNITGQEVVFDGTAFVDDERVEIIRLNGRVSNTITKTLISIKDYHTDTDIEGVTYRILDENGDVVGEWTTVHGENPYITGLDIGKQYRVVEVVPRKGYTNDVLVKDGYESDYAKDGYTYNGREYDAVDVDGVTSERNIGAFVLTDTDAVQVVTIFNKPVKAGIEVVKNGKVPVSQIKDSVLTGLTYELTGLPGTEYSVFAVEDIVNPDGSGEVLVAKGDLVKELVTGEDGKASVSDLYLGKYTVTETKAPHGYVRNTNESSVDVDLMAYYEETYYNTEDYATSAYVITKTFENEIQKVDVGSDIPTNGDEELDPSDPNRNLYLQTGIYKMSVYQDKEVPVVGAEFTLYAKKDVLDVLGNVVFPAGTQIAKAVSDENGRVAFTNVLPVGVYYAKETKTPDGYYTTDEEIVFDGTTFVDDERVEIVRLNKAVGNTVSKLLVSIMDSETEQELSNVIYQIVDDDMDEVIGEFSSSYGENELITGLTLNKQYTIRIVKPRDGYINEIVTKDDYESDYVTNGYNFNGRHYDVLETEVKDVVANIGKFVLTDDAANDVQLLNIFLNPVKASVKVMKSGEVPETVLKDNTVEMLTFTVQGLPNAQYQVLANEDIDYPDGVSGVAVAKDEVVADVVTDETGAAVVSNLYLGTYRIVETKAPAGYSRDVVNCEAIVNLSEYYKEHILSQEDYKTATFEVEQSFENHLQKVDVGSDLPPVDPEGDTTKDPFYSLYLNTGIYKYNADEKNAVPVSGAEFTLYAKEDVVDVFGNVIIPADAVVDKAVSDENGRIAFTKALPIGVYYAKETKTPVGFHTTDEAIVFDAAALAVNEKIEVIRMKDTVGNAISKAAVIISDANTGVELDDAVYRILKADGTPVGEWTSVHEANGIIKGLETGVQYTLEIVTPRSGYTNAVVKKDGYVSDYVEDGYADNTGKMYPAEDLKLGKVTKNTVKFVLSDTDAVQLINVFATPVKANLDVVKKGEVPRVSVKSGKVRGISYSVKGLPNAEYEIYAKGDIVHPDGYSENIHDGGDLVATVVTDTAGYAVVTDLYLGVYAVKEVKAPEGYVRDAENCTQDSDVLGHYETTYFDAGSYTDATFTVTNEFVNERQKLDVGQDVPPHDNPDDDRKDPDKDLYLKTGVYKIGVSGRVEQPVAGAEFTLYAKEDVTDVFGNVVIPADAEVATAVSDETGRAVFAKDIPVGDYYVKETKAPEGYHTSDEIVEWNASEWLVDEEVEILRYTGTIKNKATDVHVILRDSITKNEIACGEIQVVDDYGNVVDVVITEDTDGKGVVITGLTPGKTYHLVETKAPNGYTNHVIIPDEMSDVLTREGRNDVIFTIDDEQPTTVLVIENQFVTGTFFIDKNGEDLRCVRLTEDEKYFLGNKVTWKKTDFGYKSIKLEGAVFAVYAREDIYHPDGKTGILYHKGDLVHMNVQTTKDEAVVTTNASGCAGFWNLYLGAYEVKETIMPNGYIRNTVVTPVDLVYKDGLTQNVILEDDIVYNNERQKIDMSITKRDAENEVITVAGAVFGLYAKEDILDHEGRVIVPKDALIETVITGDDGVAHFESDLPLAMYYVKEIQAPEGYTSSDEVVVVDASTSVDCRDVVEYKLSFKNEQTKAMVSFMDYDTEVELDGIVYAIVDADGNVVRKLTSAHGKNEIIKGLALNEVYTVVEMVPRAGYGNTIYQKDGFVSKYAANGITRKDVIYSASDLTVMSVSANRLDFKLQDKGGVQVINVFNKGTMADVTVRKEGEVPVTSVKDGKLYQVRYEMKGLPGAEFAVYAEGDIVHRDGYTGVIYEDGKQIDTLITDENGNATLYDMPLGKYRVVETKAPYGYARDYEASEKVFDVSDYYAEHQIAEGFYEDEVVEFAETFTNIRQVLDIGSDVTPGTDGPDAVDPDNDKYLKTGIVKIGVVGDEEVTVEGAVFELYAAEDVTDIYGNVIIPKDTFIERVASDVNGRVRFTGFDLPSGIYRAVEIQAPDGYYPSKEDVLFDTTVRNGDDEVQIQRQSVEVRNYCTSSKLFLFDDLTGVELEGATLHILDEDGVLVDTVVTSDTAGAGMTVHGLEPGKTYQIEEVIPRYGYTNFIQIPDSMKGFLTKTAPNRVSFTVPADYVDETVVKLSNSYVTGSFDIVKYGSGVCDVKSVTEERTFSYRIYQWMKSNFNYDRVVLGGVEFTAYANSDIYHPDGKTGLLYHKGDMVRMNVRTINNKAVVTTDNKGLAKFAYLYLGDYSVKETSLNMCYIRNDTVKNVTLAYKDYVTKTVTADAAEFVNEKQKAEITVIVKDAEDKSLRPDGAIYGLYSAERIYTATGGILMEPDTLIETVSTDDRGFGVFESDIPFGRYYVKEIEPAFGYDSSDEVQEVVFAGDKSGDAVLNTTVTFASERTKTVFAIMDYDTDVELTGVNLSIYDGDGKLVTKFATAKDNNVIVRGLEHNVVYTLVQDTPNFGYSRTLYMKKDYRTPYQTIGYNDREYAAFDATDLGINSLHENVAKFKVVDRNEVQVISLFNKPVIGGISVHTTGDVPKIADGHVVYYTGGLPGMKYTVRAKEDVKALDGVSEDIYKAGDVVGDIMSDENGVAAITNLYLGTYEITETEAVNGYVRNDATTTVDIREYYEDNFYALKEYKGVPFFAEAERTNEIQKTDLGIDREPLDGVRDPENYLFGDTGITVYGQKDGRVSLISGAEFSLYAKKDVMDVYGNVLYKEGDFVTSAVSDVNGRIRFLEELPVGTYVARETGKPYGYEAFDGEVILDVASHYANDAVAIARASGSVTTETSVTTIRVLDGVTKNELDGVHFRIVASDGRVVSTGCTDDGVYTVYGLNQGDTYQFVEISAKDGYVKDMIIPDYMQNKLQSVSVDKVLFTVPDTDDLELVVENQQVTGSILVEKQDTVLDSVSQSYWECEYLLNNFKWMTSNFGYVEKGIPGCEYTVYAAEDIYHADGVTGLVYHKGDKVTSGETGADGLVYFGGLPLGHYEVRETKTLSGFASDNTVYPVTLTYKNDSTHVVRADEGRICYKNSRQKVSVSVVRKDSVTGNPLEGSIVGLYAKDDILTETGDVLVRKNTLIETQQTRIGGAAQFTADLPQGWYYVKELIAPYGHQVYAKTVDVDVSAMGDGSQMIHKTVVLQ